MNQDAGDRVRWIRNARLVLPGPARDLPIGDVLIGGGRIVGLSENGEERKQVAEAADEIFDAKGMILMPGAVNAHYHSYGCALKGTCNDLPLECWAPYTIAYGHALNRDAVRLAVLLGAAEMIRSGYTACIDHFANLALADVALGAHRQTGMRVGFAPMLQDIQDWEFFELDLPPALKAELTARKPMTAAAFEEFFLDLYRRWHDPSGRQTILLGPNAPQRCSPGLRALWRRLNERLGMQVHTHLLETRAQARRCHEVFPGGVVSMMMREGLLNERLGAAHCIWPDEHERRLMAEHGVTVINNPAANCMLGSGMMPLLDHLGAGTCAGLGTDASNSATRHDVFEAMRLALMLPRLQTRDFESWPKPDVILRMATVGGARALGLAGRIGEIAVGQQADLVLVDARHPSLVGLRQTIQTLVCHGGRETVKAVMIDGEWVYRDGRILAFNEAAVVDEFNSLVTPILAAAESGLRTARAMIPYLARADRI